jgi:hypothetical protein
VVEGFLKGFFRSRALREGGWEGSAGVAGVRSVEAEVVGLGEERPLLEDRRREDTAGIVQISFVVLR